MRAHVSVDCLSNSAELIAAGVGHLDVKSCPSSCLSANPSCPPCDYCCCCLPEVPGGRQSSTLSLFVIVCKTQYLSFDCVLIHVGSGSIPVQKVFFRCWKGAGICYHEVWAFTVNWADSFLAESVKETLSFCSVNHSSPQCRSFCKLR